MKHRYNENYEGSSEAFISELLHRVEYLEDLICRMSDSLNHNDDARYDDGDPCWEDVDKITSARK